MKMLECIPERVRDFYNGYRSKPSPGLAAAELDAWKRFVTDNRMVEFFAAVESNPEGALLILETAAPLASVDFQKVYGARDKTAGLLTAIANLADELHQKIDSLEASTASASLDGDRDFSENLDCILEARKDIGRVTGAAHKATSANLFSLNLVVGQATSKRQYSRNAAFWRALSASLSLQGRGVTPSERDLPARAIAALCSCALNVEVNEDGIKKLRSRDNS